MQALTSGRRGTCPALAHARAAPTLPVQRLRLRGGAACRAAASQSGQAASEAVASTLAAAADLPSTSGRHALYEVAAASCCGPAAGAPGAQPSGTLDIFSGISPTLILAAAGLGLLAIAIKKLFDTPSRTYDGNVGQEYDAWTEEGVLEHYWGEHIHLGYYNKQERDAGYLKKDFKQAKYDFVDEMLRFSGAATPQRVLDVGCGFGGTSRHLAKKFPTAAVQGITLSPNQVKRGTELAKEQGVPNASFQVMDALAMTFEDNTFDLVWACESGEHMPDKQKYIDEMVRVLKPGGTLVIACWCEREETPQRPFTEQDKVDLKFLYDEWAHPFFISIQQFGRCMQATGKLQNIVTADWTAPTLPSWLHSIWVGIVDPWIVVFKGPRIWYKTLREIYTIVRMHQAFASGLMEYGMMTGVKAPAVEVPRSGAAGQELSNGNGKKADIDVLVAV